MSRNGNSMMAAFMQAFDRLAQKQDPEYNPFGEIRVTGGGNSGFVARRR